jgi:pantoate--beta-alanine ligase
MKIIRNVDEMRQAVRAAQQAGRTVGFVPTMGALHAGHLSLIDAANAACDVVVVSIFVNPTQFGPNEDLSSYPRTPEADHGACQAHGVDFIFEPSVDVMYPPGAMTEIQVPALARNLCGKDRPTHFAGVCTVVAKLFNIVPADTAFFGAKDFQQVTIIRRMAADLNFPTDIVTCPTIRESDGLAMSSRNAYLSEDHRRQAVALSQALDLGAEMIRAGEQLPDDVLHAMREYLAAHAPGGEIDYIHAVAPETLVDLTEFSGPALLAVAVRFAGARLIDNVLVAEAGSGR